MCVTPRTPALKERIGQVPQDLQAFICKANGTYTKEAKESFADHLPEIEGADSKQVFAIMRYLPAEGPAGEVRDFTPKNAK